MFECKHKCQHAPIWTRDVASVDVYASHVWVCISVLRWRFLTPTSLCHDECYLKITKIRATQCPLLVFIILPELRGMIKPRGVDSSAHTANVMAALWMPASMYLMYHPSGAVVMLKGIADSRQSLIQSKTGWECWYSPTHRGYPLPALSALNNIRKSVG